MCIAHYCLLYDACVVVNEEGGDSWKYSIRVSKISQAHIGHVYPRGRIIHAIMVLTKLKSWFLLKCGFFNYRC